MEYLQVQDGESTDTAYRRLRGKLGTGKHLEETFVLLPQNVSITGGVDPAPSPDPGPGPSPTPTPEPGPTPVPDPQPGPGPSPGPVGIFDDGGTYTPFNTPPTSSLNLLGKLESWGIGTGTQVKALTLRVDQLTGAQLNELLRKLPDGITYGLELQKEES